MFEVIEILSRANSRIASTAGPVRARAKATEKEGPQAIAKKGKEKGTAKSATRIARVTVKGKVTRPRRVRVVKAREARSLMHPPKIVERARVAKGKEEAKEEINTTHPEAMTTAMVVKAREARSLMHPPKIVERARVAKGKEKANEMNTIHPGPSEEISTIHRKAKEEINTIHPEAVTTATVEKYESFT